MSEDNYIPALRFNSLTRLYDPIVRATTREAAVKRRLVEQLGSARRILDIGCGTGTLLSLMREHLPDAELVGLDVDSKIIKLARAKLGPGIQIEQGNATSPPFAAGSFDCVVSSLVFHHLTRKGKATALRAIHRLLTENGKLHLADWSQPHDIIMRVMFLGVQLLDGFETTRDNVSGELPLLIRKAGFRDVAEVYRQRTPLGSMSIIQGEK